MDGESTEVIHERFRGQPCGEMAVASVGHVEGAVTAAAEAFESFRLSPSERYDVLLRAAALVEERRPMLLATITAETGFPKGDAESEVRRCSQTLRLAADESRRIAGEMVPLDATPGLRNRIGFTVLVPRGIVCAITPYNAPLNGVAHKVAPALAAGNVVVLKPSEQTPLTAVALVKILLDAGLPPASSRSCTERATPSGAPCSRTPGSRSTRSRGARGSDGRSRRRPDSARPNSSSGSIASTIVCADADLELALPKLVAGSFRKAGQVCTSVQRIFVHRSLAEAFARRSSNGRGSSRSGILRSTRPRSGR